jgi:hypothetical protein
MIPNYVEFFPGQDLWVQAGKRRDISSRVLANSKGRSAGNPKHVFSPSMAGSQRQLFSTGKQRKAETGRRAKVPRSYCTTLRKTIMKQAM